MGGGCRDTDIRSIDKVKQNQSVVFLRGSSGKEWYLP